MTVGVTVQSTVDLSGYNNADTYLATRFTQGGRTTFSIDLSLDQLANTVTQPDPDRPTEGSRKIVIRHAMGVKGGEIMYQRGGAKLYHWTPQHEHGSVVVC